MIVQQLGATEKETLLACQFVAGLPDSMGFKLSTPKLIAMVSYCKQVLAIRLGAEYTPSPLFSATAAASYEPAPKDASPFSIVQELMTAIKKLQSQQKAVITALSTSLALGLHAPHLKSQKLFVVFSGKRWGMLPEIAP